VALRGMVQVTRPQMVFRSILVLCLTLLAVLGKIGEEQLGQLVWLGLGFLGFKGGAAAKTRMSSKKMDASAKK